MKTTVQFLAAVKKKYNLPSDYALAGKLELSRAAISRFQQGRDFLGDETAMNVADLLDLDPSYVVACIHAERAKLPEVKAMWNHTAKLLSGIAAVLIGLAVLPYPLHLDSLQLLPIGFIDGVTTVYYVKSVWDYWFIWIPLAALAIYHLPARSRRSS